MIAIKFTLFAIIATLMNLGAQWIVDWFYKTWLIDFYYPQWLNPIFSQASFYLLAAMFVGTLVGLVCKYILDKKYIFYHIPESKKHDANTFMLYTMTGIGTTLLFWGTEIGFHYAWAHPYSKYLGAAIGLSIGYICKYYLDKKYVFKKTSTKKIGA